MKKHYNFQLDLKIGIFSLFWRDIYVLSQG